MVEIFISIFAGARGGAKSDFTFEGNEPTFWARKHITTRPKVVNERKRYGDWEGDLMFAQSRREALLTFVERQTLLTVIRRVKSKSSREIAAKTIEAMRSVKCKSITNDNGFEFREHVYENNELKVPIYFTNPYSSWEKGTYENINGLIRQYLPKNEILKEVTDETIKQIEKSLNSRPKLTNIYCYSIYGFCVQHRCVSRRCASIVKHGRMRGCTNRG